MGSFQMKSQIVGAIAGYLVAAYGAKYIPGLAR